MTGWGEPHTVANAQAATERMTSDQLAIAADTFIERGTTGNLDGLQYALDAYRLARTAPR